jgi:hypothetical protein
MTENWSDRLFTKNTAFSEHMYVVVLDVTPAL